MLRLSAVASPILVMLLSSFIIGQAERGPGQVSISPGAFSSVSSALQQQRQDMEDQELRSRSGFRPIFFMHGINDYAASGDRLRDEVQRLHAGTLWIGINLYEGLPEGLTNLGSLTNLNEQVGAVYNFIKQHIAQNPNAFADGFNLVCHSQGGVVCRGLISIHGDLNVKAFISLAGPQMGIDAYGSIKDHIPDSIYNFVSKNGLYSSLVQNALSFAGYWVDMKKHDEYQKSSLFLAPLNNEYPLTRCEFKVLGGCFPTQPAPGCSRDGLSCSWPPGLRTNRNPDLKRNFAALEHAAFFGSPQDGAIVPWQSTLWGYYAMGSDASSEKPVILPFNQTEVGKQNLVPIQAMLQSGKASLHAIDNVVHTGWLNPSMVQHYIEYLK